MSVLEPEQLLQLACVVFPQEKWTITDRFVVSFSFDFFEPHMPTQRGTSQLMETLFAMHRKVGWEGIGKLLSEQDWSATSLTTEVTTFYKDIPAMLIAAYNLLVD